MWTPHPLLVGAVGLQGRHAGDPSFFLAWSEGGLLRVTGRITAPGTSVSLRLCHMVTETPQG